MHLWSMCWPVKVILLLYVWGHTSATAVMDPFLDQDFKSMHRYLNILSFH